MIPALFFIDIETTGLRPETHTIIQIAWVVYVPDSDGHLIKVGDMVERTIGTTPSDWDTASPPAIVMHEASGLKAASLATTKPTLSEVNREINATLDAAEELWNEHHDTKFKPYWAGSSVGFDKSFCVRQQGLTFPKRLHYRVFDVTSIDAFCRMFGIEPFKGPETKAHTAAADLSVTIAQLEYYKDSLVTFAEIATRALSLADSPLMGE